MNERAMMSSDSAGQSERISIWDLIDPETDRRLTAIFWNFFLDFCAEEAALEAANAGKKGEH
jgi:hypothetical protein